ncbi:hypothetical protein SRO_6590 [Streptomyces rochei]|nr:hypothetical protein SRO_6590 [Streptomyces rochei]
MVVPGLEVAARVGEEPADTITDWLPAVLPLEQTTTTVYVPGLTLDQAADWLIVVPDRATWRPCAKFAWLLVSRAAVPQLPLIWVHALVTTETLDPVVLTEMPETAAEGAASTAGSTAAAARVGAKRSMDMELRIGASGGTAGGTSHAPPRVGEHPCCLVSSQRGPGAPRTPAAPGRVTAPHARRRPRPAGMRRTVTCGQGRAGQRPVVTVRSADQPPQVPSGSRARSRTRCSSWAVRPR